MAIIIPLLMFYLFYEVPHVDGTIHNLDEIFKEALKKANISTNAVDLSDVTIKFVNKINYGDPETVREDIVDTITKEYDNPLTEEQTEVFEETFDHQSQIRWSLDDGLETSTRPKFQGSIPGKEGFDFNPVITIGDDSYQDNSATKTLTKKSNVKVPARSKITVAWNIIEKELEVPWEVELDISGNIGCDSSKSKKIGWLMRRRVLPENIFKDKISNLRFVAKGYLTTVLAYSDALKVETEDTEQPLPEIEEEPTEDDVAVADEDPKLTFVKGLLSIASDNLDSESQWQPWIKMAGGIAELSAGNTDDPQVYLDLAQSALDIVNSEQGQNILEKIKNMSTNLGNKVKDKAKTQIEKCRPSRNNRNCPDRRQPPTPTPRPGQAAGGRAPRPRPSSPNSNRRRTRAPRPGRTPLPRVTPRPDARQPTAAPNSNMRRPTVRPTVRTTTKPTTKKRTTIKPTTKKRTTKRNTTPKKKTTKKRKTG